MGSGFCARAPGETIGRAQERVYKRWNLVEDLMGGTQPVGCAGALSDFGLLQELKGSTEGDKFFVNGIADKCGCRAFVSWLPTQGRSTPTTSALDSALPDGPARGGDVVMEDDVDSEAPDNSSTQVDDMMVSPPGVGDSCASIGTTTGVDSGATSGAWSMRDLDQFNVPAPESPEGVAAWAAALNNFIDVLIRLLLFHKSSKFVLVS